MDRVRTRTIHYGQHDTRADLQHKNSYSIVCLTNYRLQRRLCSSAHQFLLVIRLYSQTNCNSSDNMGRSKSNIQVTNVNQSLGLQWMSFLADSQDISPMVVQLHQHELPSEVTLRKCRLKHEMMATPMMQMGAIAIALQSKKTGYDLEVQSLLKILVLNVQMATLQVKQKASEWRRNQTILLNIWIV